MDGVLRRVCTKRVQSCLLVAHRQRGRTASPAAVVTTSTSSSASRHPLGAELRVTVAHSEPRKIAEVIQQVYSDRIEAILWFLARD